MQENSLGPFHSELLRFLKGEVDKRISEDGLDPAFDSELTTLLRGLDPVSSDVAIPLDQIIENYQHLFNDRGPVYLEKVVMEAFDPKEFLELGLWRYYPRMYRGLPRLFHRDFPAQSHIKKPFTHVPSLKKIAVMRALYSLYSNFKVNGRVTIFTWVINDGLGDYVAALEVAQLLTARFPHLDVRLVALVNEKRVDDLPWPESAILIKYEKEGPVDAFTQEALLQMRQSDLILQIPTFYPEFNALIERLKKIDSEAPMPIVESVGEYGFLESNWFHPKSSNHSMGLHFLEKGILIRKPIHPSWDDVSNAVLKSQRDPANHFYLAYLSTQIGGAIYLHALLKSLENDDRSIDVCVPDLGWFFQFVEKQNELGNPILEWDLGVQAIEICFEGRFHSIPIAEQGKKLRLLCPGKISGIDFRLLLALSGNWVGVRGNQSFSEAISQGKAFFYDGREHARYFIKDLVAIAENRVGEYRGTLDCIRGMGAGFIYNLPIQEEEWVDETFFQTIEEWTVIALNLGLSLQDPETFEGFTKLSQILIQEKSVNRFICHLVQRALIHKEHPHIAQEEEESLGKFTSGVIPFKELIQTQKSALAACQKTSTVG